MNGLFSVLVISFVLCIGLCLSVYPTADGQTARELRSRIARSVNTEHADGSYKDGKDITRMRHVDATRNPSSERMRKRFRIHNHKAIKKISKRRTAHKHNAVKHRLTADKTFRTNARGPKGNGARAQEPAHDRNHILGYEVTAKPNPDNTEKSRVDDQEKSRVDELRKIKDVDIGKLDEHDTDEIKHDNSHNRHGKEDKKRSKNHRLSKKTLTSLRNALLIHPFSTWKFKDRFQSMNDLGIHEAQLHDIIEHKWNYRLKRKLRKVLKGEDIHLAIIGGSNSAGGGIEQDEGGTQGIFFRVISDWWQKTITTITGSHLKTRQIALGGTGSDFFQYCYGAYIQKNVDLVLLEMSVNDLKELPLNVNLSLPIEQLTRQLLEFPTHPAILYVNLLSGRAYYQGCTNLEDFGQRLLSDAYNITTFSWRDAVCPKVGGSFRTPLKSCGVVCKDGHHINQLGHAHISLMVINFFRDILLDNIYDLDKRSRAIFHDNLKLPEPVFITKPSKLITSPSCWTTVSPDYKKTRIKNSMDVGVMENFGFDYLHDSRMGGECRQERFCRADAYSGWTGKDVGAIITLSFTVPPLGRKRRIKSRSVVFATRTCFKCGAAYIWLDDDYANRRYVKAKSVFSQTYLEIIGLRVDPGDHTMSVRVVYPGDVTVVGVMLGPPDGPY